MKSYNLILVILFLMPSMIYSQKHNDIMDKKEDYVLKNKSDSFENKLIENNCINPNLMISNTTESIIVNNSHFDNIKEFQKKTLIIKDLVKKFYNEYYEKKGIYSLVQESTQIYLFQIDKMTQEIIKTNNYWEQITVIVNFEMDRYSQNLIVVNNYIGGYYVAKRGNNPQYEKSLNIDKSKELNEYNRQIRNKLNDYLN